MASARPRHGLIGRLPKLPRNIGLPLLWPGFLTLLIAGPWLLPGYIFGTDWPGPRRFDFPTSVASSAPLSAGLAAVSWVIGGEVTGKLFVLSILFAAGALTYRSLPSGGFVPRAMATTAYLINPFVYGRLQYGQLFLLAAYAALPWTAARFRLFLNEPRVRTALVVAVAFTLIGIGSEHVLVMASL